MAVAVTGGAGFIGSHLCEALLARGMKVINIDSFNNFYNPSIKYRNAGEILSFAKKNGVEHLYKIEEGDIRDLNFLKKVFEGYKVKTVVHLAAYAGVRPSIQNPSLYTDVNINGTLNLLEICKDYGIKEFVFASSSSVYGNNEKVPFSEGDCVDFPISPYAATKKAGELLCHTYHSLYNINIACLRFFTVYGPRQRPDLAIHKFTKLIDEGKTIELYGDGSTERDYTYIDDIIDGILKSMDWIDDEVCKYGIFNLGESNTVSLNRMLQTLEDILQKRAVIRYLEMQPGDVIRTFANIEKSKKVLNYNPQTGFQEGMEKFISWYKSSKRNLRS